MSRRTVTVTAPSRLHFGMFSFGQPGVRQFGGVGVMVDKPGLQLRISPAVRFTTIGPLAERMQVFAHRVCDQLEMNDELLCEIAITQAPPEHVGFGVGTQLGLSIAAGLNAFWGRPPLDPIATARLAGRGERSAIGTYGFANGGLLIEAGKLLNEALSPLEARTELPAEWRFVLSVPRDQQGVHGVDERRAFHELRPVPPETTAKLRSIALDRLFPAAKAANFAEFSDALYCYGHTAGLCFATFQHGAYATAISQRLVEEIRAIGVAGVGQSSWGPSLFSLVPDAASAAKLVESLRQIPEAARADLLIAAADNRGVRIETE